MSLAMELIAAVLCTPRASWEHWECVDVDHFEYDDGEGGFYCMASLRRVDDHVVLCDSLVFRPESEADIPEMASAIDAEMHRLRHDI